MYKVMIIILVAVSVLTPLRTSAEVPEGINLGDRRFNASGQGNITTIGSIAQGATALSLDSSTTWRVGHGVRVRRAGGQSLVHTADAGWVVSPTTPAGAGVAHDKLDKVEGGASVRCSFSGTSPDADDGRPDPVDICEVDVGSPIDTAFDELRFWVKSSVAIKGNLQIRVLGADRAPTFELAVPAIGADKWIEVFVELKRRLGFAAQFTSGQRIITLQCISSCDGISVHLDDFRLVKDLVARVDSVKSASGGKAIFQLNRAAGRTVTREVVYHDDTVAVRTWLEQANTPGGAKLFAPSGVYYINSIDLFAVGGAEANLSLPLYNDTLLICASADTTTFKNTGSSATGPGVMFRSAAPAPTNIAIEGCGFDWNGWNLQDYLTVILIKPHTNPQATAQNIQIRHNKFFDSNLPGIAGCDFGQDQCATRQRHHVLVQKVDGIWIEDNQMSGGGRIKVGGQGLGRNMHIRSNRLDFVNDNAITIVDTVAGITEHVEITDNTIINPVASGIFFGADGEPSLHVPGMRLQDVTIARNRIDGFFATAGIMGDLPESAADIHIIDNVVQARRATEIQTGYQYVAGILLKRETTALPATGMRVEGNSIVAFGPQAVFNVAAIAFFGSLSDLSIARNTVLCDRCGTIDFGIWLRYGAFENVTLSGNMVNGAGVALFLGFEQEASGFSLANGSILNNQFLSSRNANAGQVTIESSLGESIAARLAGNYIQGGAGYGMLCAGTSEVGLVDILANDFAGNARGDILGCP